jgi:Coenzyme PQQ synthesis protein D (PqqD)
LTSYATAHADIAHERVDDEVIAINLRTGAYFSLVGAAADAWSLLVVGMGVDQVASTLADRYGIAATQAAADLEPFLAAVIADELLTAAGGEPVAAAGELPPVTPGAAYRAPTLDKYDDMEELLLLDPIHEVDEAGWPVVAAEPIDS